MRNFSKTEQSGRSMVEMLGVLAIIGVLSVGGISGYSKAMAKYKASKAMDQLSLLIANIRTAYSTMSNYTGLTNGTAKKYSIASRDMFQDSSVADSAKLVNGFGGDLIIVAETYNGIADAGFSITYKGLNEESCIQLATADWGTGGLDSIVVGGDGAVTIPVKDMPVSLDTDYTNCKKLDDGRNTTSISWHFY